MRINNNIMAMNAHRQLGQNTALHGKSIEKLSSGLRINRAGDDAAGLAISEKMRGQVRGLTQASRNAQDDISLIQTTEGALNETHAIIQRMREMAVQSSNDSNTDEDRSALQNEMDQLAEEITRIANTTEFNTRKLINGNLDNSVAGATGNLTFHIGANSGQNMAYSVHAMDAFSLDLTENRVNSAAAGKLTRANVSRAEHSQAFEDIAAQKAEADQKITITAEVVAGSGEKATTKDVEVAEGNTVNFTFEEGEKYNDIKIRFVEGAADELGVTFDKTSKTMEVSLAKTTAANNTADKIQAKVKDLAKTITGYDFTEATVTGSGAGYLKKDLTKDAGSMITADGEDRKVKITAKGTGESKTKYEESITINQTAKNVTFQGQMRGLSVDFVKDENVVEIPEITGTDNTVAISLTESNAATFNNDHSVKKDAEAVQGINILTQSSADNAIDRIDSALKKVSDERAKLGAVQNRLEHTIRNVNTSAENLQASESRIRDVDMAKEMMTYTKNNILNQAAQAMLAQANQAPQGVLQLLR